MKRIDTRTLIIMLIAIAIGLAWAIYNYSTVGSARSNETLRPLIWAVFSTPFALFIGWLIARRNELPIAAFCCFVLYFATFFVAARIESFILTSDQSAAEGHQLYFFCSMAIHGLAGAALAVWRALSREQGTGNRGQSGIESNAPL
jgi:cytochrome bd-type quinol oxidase subunit 2